MSAPGKRRSLWADHLQQRATERAALDAVDQAAAHIVMADAVALGGPEVIIMTRPRGPWDGGAEITRWTIPARYANDYAEIISGLGMCGWRPVGEPLAANTSGYWIVNVERAS